MITDKEINDRIFKTHGNKIEMIGEYVGMAAKALFRCCNGHTWRARPINVVRRNGCPICWSIRRSKNRANPETGLKICAKKTCIHNGMPQPISNFNKWNGSSDGLQCSCKDCELKYRKDNPDRDRIYHLKKLYNLTMEEFNVMISHQRGICPICNKEFDSNNRLKLPVVDHDHDTGLVRGILCSTCNINIGHFTKDSMRRALRYLRIGSIRKNNP